MRVLHINCNYVGTALHRTMIQHLRKQGGEHFVFAPSDGREAWKNFVPEDGERGAECYTRRDRYFFFKKQHQIRRSLEKNYDVSTFDCLHAYTVYTDGNCAMRLSRKYGLPYVVAVRSTDLNGFFKWRKLLRLRGLRILKNASAVFFLSERYRSQLMERYIPKAMQKKLLEKSYVIPNGIHPFWLENIPAERTAEDLERISSGKIKLLFVGRICKRKKSDLVGKAAKKLNGQGMQVEFTAVGRVTAPEVLEEMEKSGCFTYIPPKQKEELLEIYRRHDIFVMPSKDETFGLVYPEAMTQRLPVIYSKGEGFDGQIPEGEAGYAVTPDSVDEIADKICEIQRNYKALSDRGPELAKRFNWEAITKQYTEIYNRILSANH